MKEVDRTPPGSAQGGLVFLDFDVGRPLMASKKQGQANPTMDNSIRAAVTLSRIPRLKKLIPLQALELSFFLVTDYLILSYFRTGVPEFEGKIISFKFIVLPAKALLYGSAIAAEL